MKTKKGEKQEGREEAYIDTHTHTYIYIYIYIYISHDSM